jgi:K+-transporting ATPase ATPase C chain
VLIGQQFASDAYFQGRPSATLGADPAQPGASVPAPYNAGSSGASNQGATHQGLAEVVAQRVDQYRAVNGLAAQVGVPVDAVTASASGLDPHISLANAQLQVARVAKARGLTPDQVQQLVQDHTQPRTLFLLGEPRVHVLQLNLALDAAAPTTAKE